MYVKEESRQNAQLISFPLSLSPFFLTSAHVQNGERERESMCTRVYRPDRVPSGKINVQGLWRCCIHSYTSGTSVPISVFRCSHWPNRAYDAAMSANVIYRFLRSFISFHVYGSRGKEKR